VPTLGAGGRCGVGTIGLCSGGVCGRQQFRGRFVRDGSAPVSGSAFDRFQREFGLFKGQQPRHSPEQRPLGVAVEPGHHYSGRHVVEVPGIRRCPASTRWIGCSHGRWCRALPARIQAWHPNPECGLLEDFRAVPLGPSFCSAQPLLPGEFVKGRIPAHRNLERRLHVDARICARRGRRIGRATGCRPRR